MGKRFGIEIRYPATSCAATAWMKQWHPWKWYATAKQRDQAFEKLTKHPSNIYAVYRHHVAPKYRKVDR